MSILDNQVPIFTVCGLCREPLARGETCEECSQAASIRLYHAIQRQRFEADMRQRAQTQTPSLLGRILSLVGWAR